MSGGETKLCTKKSGHLGGKCIGKIYSNLKFFEALKQVRRAIQLETPVTLFCI